MSNTDIKRIDLNLLVVLDALLDERNVTRAAARLGYTQPTVSAMLGRLRSLFADPLFIRAQRGLIATPRAEELAVPLKRLLADSRQLVAPEVFDPEAATTTFTVSTNDYLQRTLLVPFIEVLRAEAKRIRLAIAQPLIEGLSDALARGRIDMAITIPEFATPELKSRLLYRERYVVAVRKAHPLARRAKMTVRDFCAFDHVLVSPTNESFVGPADRALAKLDQRRVVRYSVPSFLLVPELLQVDDLVAVVPSRLIAPQQKQLVVLPPPIEIPGFDVIEVWHPRVHEAPAHQWLRTRLAAMATRQ